MAQSDGRMTRRWAWLEAVAAAGASTVQMAIANHLVVRMCRKDGSDVASPGYKRLGRMAGVSKRAAIENVAAMVRAKVLKVTVRQAASKQDDTNEYELLHGFDRETAKANLALSPHRKKGGGCTGVHPKQKRSGI